MIRSVSLLPYNIGSPYSVHTFLIDDTARLVTWHWPHFLGQFLHWYNLGSPYLVHTLIMVGACQPGMCHITLTSFSWSTEFYWIYVKFLWISRLFHYLIYNQGSHIEDVGYMSVFIYISHFLNLSCMYMYFKYVYFMENKSHKLVAGSGKI